MVTELILYGNGRYHEWDGYTMRKQIDYWMEYDSFLLIAQKAIDYGCTIVKEDAASGKIIEQDNISIVTRDQSNAYYFHVLEAGPIEIEQTDNAERLKRYNCDGGNVVIEAGYSAIVNDAEKRIIRRAHMGCETGYYDDKGIFVPRPECLTKVYHNLLRYVRRLAPYTELNDKIFQHKGKKYGKELEYIHSEYITKTCLDMRNKEGYKLAQI